MLENLTMMQTSFAMARHAGARQAITAANMANADTPGYRARTIASFSDTYSTQTAGEMRQTRSTHLGTTALTAAPEIRFSDAEASPNGNSVSIEMEMVNAVEIQREHSRALTIYQHGLNVLRASIDRR